MMKLSLPWILSQLRTQIIAHDLGCNSVQADIQNVRDCTGDDLNGVSSKYDYTDKKGLKRNYVLEAEIQQQKDDNVFTIPTILINDFPYRGGFKCSKPPNLKSADSCPVLNAVCKAFTDAKKPPACKTDFCWYKQDDCGTVRRE